MKTYLYFKHSGEKLERSPVNGKNLELKEMQKLVGGYIELLSIMTDKLMVLNEEGVLRGLPYNLAASILAGRDIVGDVIICDRSLIGN
jgi:hypothetical protein